MQVEIARPEEVVTDSQLAAMGPEVGESGLGRFLHHVAQRAGELQLAVTADPCGLDEEDLATVGSPGQPGCDTDLVDPPCHLGVVPGCPQEAGDLLGRDLVGYFLVESAGLRDLPADGRQVALEGPHTRVTGVPPENGEQR